MKVISNLQFLLLLQATELTKETVNCPLFGEYVEVLTIFCQVAHRSTFIPYLYEKKLFFVYIKLRLMTLKTFQLKEIHMWL